MTSPCRASLGDEDTGAERHDWMVAIGHFEKTIQEQLRRLVVELSACHGCAVSDVKDEYGAFGAGSREKQAQPTLGGNFEDPIQVPVLPPSGMNASVGLPCPRTIDTPVSKPSLAAKDGGEVVVSTPSISSRSALALKQLWADDEEPTILDGAEAEMDSIEDTVPVLADLRGQTRLVQAKCMETCVISPTSAWKLAWVNLSLIAICTDCIILPLHAFYQEDVYFPPELDSLLLGTTIFWSVDLVVGFLFGYRTGYQVEMRPCHICRHRLRTWFFPDLILVLFDWLEAALKWNAVLSWSKALRAGRVGRMWPAMRMLKTLRIQKVYKLVKYTLSLNVEILGVVGDMAQLLCCMAFLAHFVACAWYYWVKAFCEDRPNWIEELGSEKSVGFHYIVSFHWVMAQVTPAPTPYAPQNTAEFVFASLILFCGFFVFSSVLGKVAGDFSLVQKKAADQRELQTLFRRFVVENNVPLGLTQQIKEYFEMHVHKRKRVLWCQIPALKLLPQRLQIHLRYHVCVPVLRLHPLLHGLDFCDHKMVVDISVRAVSESSWKKRQELFCYGGVSTGMLFVLAGTLEYTRGVHGNDESDVSIVQGNWLCEPALWTDWHHRGSLVARSDCDAMELNANALCDIVLRRPLAMRSLRKYARLWFDTVAASSPKTLDDCGPDFDVLQRMAEACVPRPFVSSGTEWPRFPSPWVKREIVT